MKKILELYNSTGRTGNIILLILLILSGFFNRLWMIVKYREIDFMIEAVLIILALIIVFRIYKKNIFDFDRQKILKILLISGIAFRIILGIHDFYNRPVQESDYAKHEKLGYRIAFEHEYYDFVGVELRNFRQPGLPALFAVGLWIYNDPATYAAVMIIFSMLTVIAGYYLFKDLKNIAALAAFGYIAISPNMLFMASNSNTQLSFFFFLILLFIVLKNYTGKTYQLFLIGLFLACEMYIRFNFLMMFLMIPFILEKHSDQNLTYSLKKMSLAFLFFLIPYSPWIYRNYLIYGTFKITPNSEGLRFYTANVIKDYTKAGGYNGIPDSVISLYNKLPETEFDAALKRDAINYITENPGFYMKGMPFRLIRYSGRQDWTVSYFFTSTKYEYGNILNLFFQSVENFFFWLILFLPLLFLWRNKSLSPLSTYILWSYLSYSIIMLAVSETRSRYNFPYILFPLIAVSFIERKKITDEKQTG